MTQSLEYQLTLYPDPILRKVALPLTSFGSEVERLVEAMLARMRASKGVGLAAPQIGLRQRVLVLNASGEPADDLALINVEIVERFGPPTLFDEGCLSFPGIYAEVERPDGCLIRACDPQGKSFERSFTGFESRIIQHEYDHLEGILLVDRMSPAEKVRNKAALEEMVERYKSRRK